MTEEDSALLLGELAKGYKDWVFFPGAPDEMALTFLNDHSYIGDMDKVIVHAHQNPIHVAKCTQTSPPFEGLVYSNGAVFLLWVEPSKYIVYLWVNKTTWRTYGYPNPKTFTEFIRPHIEELLEDDEATPAG